jgi:LacI family transcriptional regulator, gluconate utilization system Gnt-I transcriptional repressor
LPAVWSFRIVGGPAWDKAEMNRKRTTLSDVASSAGVSAVTVSRALRHPDMVSAELRARVERAVDELGYIPNRLAAALASARTHTVGALVPSLTNGVFADYLRALHDVFLPAGCQILVSNTRYAPDEEEKAIATLLGQHPEAMIVAGIDQTPAGRAMLANSGIPVVQTMELADDPIDINIGVSQHDAGRDATRYLFDLGHRRIGQISARLDARSRRRIEGYRQAMGEFGIDATPLVAITPRPSTVRLGAELFAELLARNPDVEAVFCCNDDLALGALFECHRRGISVPDEMSIVGFNDLEFCASAYPSLTSVAIPRYEMAEKAARIVLDIIRGPGERPPETRIDLGYRIVERQSSGRKRAAMRAGSQPAAALLRDPP